MSWQGYSHLREARARGRQAASVYPVSGRTGLAVVRSPSRMSRACREVQVLTHLVDPSFVDLEDGAIGVRNPGTSDDDLTARLAHYSNEHAEL